MSSNRKTPYPLQRTPNKRELIGETREEEAVRLALEIAAHPVTKCEPGVREKDAREAESIAKKMMRKS